jgi:DNA repair exonuclease SbcCD ATPase subunit
MSAEAYLKIGLNSKAIRQYEKVKKYYEKEGEFSKIGKTNRRIGEIYARSKDYENALENFDDALGYDLDSDDIEHCKDLKEVIKKILNIRKELLIIQIILKAINTLIDEYTPINLKELIKEIQDIWKKFFSSDEREILYMKDQDKDYLIYFKHKDKGKIINIKDISAGEKMILIILVKSILLKNFTSFPFLIFDEPLEHLDLENRIKIIDFFITLYRKGMIKQLIITTFEESLIRQYLNSSDVNIISLPTLLKYEVD